MLFLKVNEYTYFKSVSMLGWIINFMPGIILLRIYHSMNMEASLIIAYINIGYNNA